MNRFPLTARAESAAAARRIIASAPLDRVRLAEAQLMITELVANAIRHTGLDPTDSIFLSLDSDPARIRVGLSHPAAEPIGEVKPGWGFRLLGELARSWDHHWEAGILEVWFEVRAAGTGVALADLDDLEVLTRARTDPRCRDEAVTRYGGLAGALARRFRGKGEADSDLEQVALMGLLQAIIRYDPDRGSFEPFAAATILGELKRHLRDKAWSVRVPRGLQERSLLVGRTADALTQSLGRAAHPADIAAELGIGEDEVVEALAANSAYRWESIDLPHPETGSTLADQIHEEDDWAELAAEWHGLTEAIGQLPERESRILYLRFYRDLTQTEIAERLGISQMHVSRLLARALDKIRDHVGP